MTAAFLVMLLAADAKIVRVEGAPKAGRDGEWRAAKAGATVSDTELMLLGPKERVVLALPDGSEKTLEGRAIVNLRRIFTATSAEKASVLAAASRVASRNIEAAEASTAIAPRGAETEENPRATGRRAVAFLGADESLKAKSTDADFAEWHLRQGDYRAAVARAWAILASPDPAPTERRRAHLVLATVWIREGALTSAMGDLDAAASISDDPALAPHRAAALVQRGQLHMQLAEDAKAETDFTASIDAAPTSSAAAQAHFFLGALALARGETDVAKSRFARLDPHPELRQAADELLSTMSP